MGLETVTRYDAAHAGEPAYELYPVVEGITLFIKVTIIERGGELNERHGRSCRRHLSRASRPSATDLRVC